MPDKINPLLEALRAQPWAILEDWLPEALKALGLMRPAPEPVVAGEVAPQGGVMVLPIRGTIVPKQALVYQGTGMDLLREQLRAAAANEAVKAIVLDVDSPGGMVDGVQETGELIRSIRTQKPVLAHTDSLAASAAYWLAAQAGELVAGRDAMVGSIGSLIIHGDFSGMYAEAGIKVTIMRNPPRKAEGNPLEPLSEAAQARYQEIVDLTTGMFQAEVAKGRGVAVGSVRSDYGQGTLLLAREALGAGMVDRIETLDATLSRALKGRRGIKTFDAAGAGVLVSVLQEDEGQVVAIIDPPRTPAEAERDREAMNAQGLVRCSGQADGAADQKAIRARMLNLGA